MLSQRSSERQISRTRAVELITLSCMPFVIIIDGIFAAKSWTEMALTFLAAGIWRLALAIERDRINDGG